MRDALHQIRDAIDAYKVASKDGRVPVESGASGYPPKLNVLADGVKDQSNPKGARIYFLRRVPRDPMNNDPQLDAVERGASAHMRASPTIRRKATTCTTSTRRRRASA